MNESRVFGRFGLAALALLFIVAVSLVNVGLRGLRLDLTENSLYTLSDGTYKILDGIDEPINLYFFYSDRATGDIPLSAHLRHAGGGDAAGVRAIRRRQPQAHGHRPAALLRRGRPRAGLRPAGASTSAPRRTRSTSVSPAPTAWATRKSSPSSIPTRKVFSNTTWPS